MDRSPPAADFGASRPCLSVSMCPRPSLLEKVAQAVGITAILVVLVILVVAVFSVLYLGRQYHNFVSEAKAAGHGLVDWAAGVAQSPLVSEAVGLEQAVRKIPQKVGAAAQSAKKTASAASERIDCYQWLGSRQGYLMSEAGGGLTSCQAAQQAVTEAMAGLAGPCPPSGDSAEDNATNRIYRVFLDAQCPWASLRDALRPNGQRPNS